MREKGSNSRDQTDEARVRHQNSESDLVHFGSSSGDEGQRADEEERKGRGEKTWCHDVLPDWAGRKERKEEEGREGQPEKKKSWLEGKTDRRKKKSCLSPGTRKRCKNVPAPMKTHLRRSFPRKRSEAEFLAIGNSQINTRSRDEMLRRLAWMCVSI